MRQPRRTPRGFRPDAEDLPAIIAPDAAAIGPVPIDPVDPYPSPPDPPPDNLIIITPASPVDPIRA